LIGRLESGWILCADTFGADGEYASVPDVNSALCMHHSVTYLPRHECFVTTKLHTSSLLLLLFVAGGSGAFATRAFGFCAISLIHLAHFQPIVYISSIAHARTHQSQ
jgi:hypothetical protein